MFVNRQKELKLLEDEYTNSNFRFTIIYGRRRVGKTTLIKEYISSKPYIYFLVTLEALPTAIERFQNLVADFLEDEFLREIKFKSFEQIFSYLVKQNLSKKVVVVIDEFQYLGKLDKSIRQEKPTKIYKIVLRNLQISALSFE